VTAPTAAVVVAADEFSFSSGGDWPRLEAALTDAGIIAERCVWDDPAVRWDRFAGVVVRSPWDYLARRGEFVAWARATERTVPIANPAAVLDWNTDKRYLRDLAGAGLHVTETVWVEPGDTAEPPPWTDFVVKPSVGAGAVGAARYGTDDWAAAAAHVTRINATGAAALVQPYLHRLDEAGETGTYLFGGEPSHAIGKTAILRPGAPPVDDYSLAATQVSTPRPLDPDLVGLAQRAAAAAPGRLLYVRVDTAPTADGPVIIEMEAVEPHLFLSTSDHAAARFAAAVAGWLRSVAG
jgi:glutathione synthase/RimK-type ligase-like ATP-grasp enzyme